MMLLSMQGVKLLHFMTALWEEVFYFFWVLHQLQSDALFLVIIA